MSCSRTQYSDAGEAGTRGPSVSIKHSTTEPLHSLMMLDTSCLSLTCRIPVCMNSMLENSMELDNQLILFHTVLKINLYDHTVVLKD